MRAKFLVVPTRGAGSFRRIGAHFAGTCALLAIAAATPASAQSVISRSITTEPVETVVTQTPTGTIVTRRPLDSPVAAPAPVVSTAPDTIDAITTREVVRRVETTQPTVRELVTREVAHRPEPRTVVRHTVQKRTVKRSASVTRTVRPRIALDPAERQIIYQTIVEREVRPTREIVVAPPAVAPMLQTQIVRATTPVVAQDEAVATAPVYAVGSVLPANTPLYAMPQEVGLRFPVTQSYSYAYLGGHAYLVDPTTGVIVEDVTQ